MHAMTRVKCVTFSLTVAIDSADYSDVCRVMSCKVGQWEKGRLNIIISHKTMSLIGYVSQKVKRRIVPNLTNMEKNANKIYRPRGGRELMCIRSRFWILFRLMPLGDRLHAFDPLPLQLKCSSIH